MSGYVKLFEIDKGYPLNIEKKGYLWAIMGYLYVNQIDKQGVISSLRLVALLRHSWSTCWLSNITDLLLGIGSHQNLLFTRF